MRTEYLKIESGILETGGRVLLSDFEYQHFLGDVVGIYSDNAFIQNLVVKVFENELSLSGGIVTYKGEKVSDSGDLGAIGRKVRVIDHNSRLISNLSLAENLFVPEQRRMMAFVKPWQLKQRLEKILAEFDLEHLKDVPVSLLSGIEQCQIELIRGYSSKAELLILDCRHMNFSLSEMEQLFKTVDKVRKSNISIIFMHNLAMQLLKYSDSVVFLKEDRTAFIADKKFMSTEELFEISSGIYGRQKTSKQHMVKGGHRTLFAVNDYNGEYLRNFNMEIHERELQSVVLSDQDCFKELCGLLKGEIAAKNGQIVFQGKNFRIGGVEHLIKNRICLMDFTENVSPHFRNLTVYDNIAISKGKYVKGMWLSGKIKKSVRQFICNKYDNDLNSKYPYMLTWLQNKKLVFYKWMLFHPKLAICISPFAALDAVSANEIRQVLYEYADSGIAVLILTPNKHEVDAMEGSVIYV